MWRVHYYSESQACVMTHFTSILRCRTIWSSQAALQVLMGEPQRGEGWHYDLTPLLGVDAEEWYGFFLSNSTLNSPPRVALSRKAILTIF